MKWILKKYRYPLPKKLPASLSGYLKAQLTLLRHLLDPVLANIDAFTPANFAAQFIAAFTESLRIDNESEIVAQDAEAQQLIGKRAADRNRLADRQHLHKTRLQQMETEFSQLSAPKWVSRITVGGWNVPIGLLATNLFMIIDACINFNYFDTIYVNSMTNLIFSVASMSLLSDFSMYFAARLLCHSGPMPVSKQWQRGLFLCCIAAFLISAVVSFATRFGTMGINLSLPAMGNQLPTPKTDFGVADYAATLTTSLLTSATGMCSFLFSIESPEAARFYKLSNSIRRENQAVRRLQSRLDAIDGAPDISLFLINNRKVAEENINAVMLQATASVPMWMAESLGSAEAVDHMNAPASTSTTTI